MPGDYDALDFTGTFVNLTNLSVAEISFHREVFRITGAAVYLDGVTGGFIGRFGRKQLRYRRFL
jgi:hypothetical protein